MPLYVKFSHVGLKSEETTGPGVALPHTFSLPTCRPHLRAEQPEEKGGSNVGFKCENTWSSDLRVVDPQVGPRRRSLPLSWDSTVPRACPAGRARPRGFSDTAPAISAWPWLLSLLLPKISKKESQTHRWCGSRASII